MVYRGGIGMAFGRKKPEEPHKKDTMLARGIYLTQPEMDNGSIVLRCFWRCVIVFVLTFGSVGGFLSAFQISCNLALVIFFYILLSMYFSFLYSTTKLLYRDLGYILFFAIFVFVIYNLRIYANSGFYSIVNEVLRKAQVFFGLSGIREYDAPIENTYVTVAIVAVFIGMVIIIVLNIWLYSTMSLFFTMLFTFPLLLIPLYMKLLPDPFYVICLAAGYAAVVVFKANGHYLTFAWDASFRVRGLKKDRVTYTQDAKIFRQVLTEIAVIAVAVVVLVETVFPSAFFASRFRNDVLREKTAETIGNFVLLGFAGMFNHYPSTGGMSGGKLGGISNVRPDYQTDLVVSFTPYSNEPIYLKGYTGGIYGDNQWESIYTGGTSANDRGIFEEESLKKEAEWLKKRAEADTYESAAGKMDVLNVGADTAYLYYPYYTVFEDYGIYDHHRLMPTAQGLMIEEEVQYSYYPKLVWEDTFMGKIPSGNAEASGIDPVFLDVPYKNQEVIEKECARIGLTGDMSVGEIVGRVRNYFQIHIPYTLKPGATPRNQDFVNYFLTKNRKGYCAHFASAATLIFRQMGIPARYVEGYAFNLEMALTSDINETKKYEDYYSGYSELGESAVLDVEVPDANAHAWVEIYVDGFGWRPVEITPGSNEAADESDFWSAFGNILGGFQDSDAGGNDGRQNRFSIEKILWLLYAAGAVLCAIWLLSLVRVMHKRLRRYLLCHQKDEQEAMIARYADVCEMLRICHDDFDGCRSHGEQIAFMRDRYGITVNSQEMTGMLEQASYSLIRLENQQLQQAEEFIRETGKCIRKAANFRTRMRLWKR